MKTFTKTLIATALVASTSIASADWNKTGNGIWNGNGISNSDVRTYGDTDMDSEFESTFSFSFSGKARGRGNGRADGYASGYGYGNGENYYYGSAEDRSVYPYANGWSPYGNYGTPEVTPAH